MDTEKKLILMKNKLLEQIYTTQYIDLWEYLVTIKNTQIIVANNEMYLVREILNVVHIVLRL